jgi:hypothetical protein
MADTILIPKDTPDWQQILNDTQKARSDAEKAARSLGALGGIDGTVQSTSDLPGSTSSGEYYFVVDESSYYKDTGNGPVQNGWEQSGPDLDDASSIKFEDSQDDYNSSDVEGALQEIEAARNADNIDRGTLSDARLPQESVLEDEKNNFSETQTIKHKIKRDRSKENPYRTRGVEKSGPISLVPHKSISNPVLFDGSVNDLNADFVADPFIVYENGSFWCFFEVKEDGGGKAISYAKSPDGLEWSYGEEVIDGSNLLAYPHVFRHDGNWYMTPDNQSTGPSNTRDFEIWKSSGFPRNWSVAEEAITDVGSDPTPFYIEEQNRWYVIVGYTNQSGIHLYYADQGYSIEGRSWTEHPSSTLTGNGNIQGPAGRPIVYDDGIVDIPLQSDPGGFTRLYRITNISPSSFSMSELSSSPILNKGSSFTGWKSKDMHHVDIMMDGPTGEPIAMVDGADSNNNFRIGVYTVTDQSTNIAQFETNNANITDGGTYQKVGASVGNTPEQPDDLDTGGGFNPITTGLYYVELRLKWNFISKTNTSRPFTARIKLRDTQNGNDIVQSTIQVSEYGFRTMQCSGVFFIPFTGRVEPFASQSSGDDQVITGNNQTNSHFLCKRIY